MNNHSCLEFFSEVSKERLEKVSELFKAMGDQTRLGLLCLLLKGEQKPGELTKKLKSSQSAISHQLRILRGLHLVRSRRDGKSIFYSLADQHVGDLIETAFTHADEPKNLSGNDPREKKY